MRRASRYARYRAHRRNHAKIRAEERYGLWLHNQDLQNIVGMIRNNRATPVKRLSHTKKVYLVVYLKKPLIVLYSKKHREVITFLPKDNYVGQETGKGMKGNN